MVEAVELDAEIDQAVQDGGIHVADHDWGDQRRYRIMQN